MKKIGRYQITRELGRGAMGVVYHAIDPTIGRAVAIKTLRIGDVDDGEQRLRLRERLFREARSAGALSHPGIVTIYDMDEADGLAYIAMEFVDGETLDDVLARPQGLERNRVIEILQQASAALDYAHRKGIIHRDIKPANVMIDTTGAVKITDFGIAKITEMAGQTQTGAMIGTPNYMSPEQIQGHETDGRSDQFSLGVIAYEMLTGERPFHGEQISTVVYKIVAEQPVPVQNVNSSLNDGVDKVLRRGLAKKPERRFASCTAFTTGLTGALDKVKNWRVLPRRAHQNLPTAAVTGAFRPIRKLSREGEVGKAKRRVKTVKRRSGVLPFLGAFVFLLLLLSVVAWQAGVLNVPGVRGWFAAEQGQGTPSSETAASEGDSPKPMEMQPAPEETASGSADRPSPMPAAPALAVASTAATAPAATAPAKGGMSEAATLQQVQIMTNPAEARATLDGQAGTACQTPCKLRARSGVHTLTVTREGYQPESREIRVGHQDIDYPLLTLRSANGILLLTSDPDAARVWIDGKPTDSLTPVRINLPAGPHQVEIRKDGMQSSDQVEIQNGALSSLRLTVRRP